MVFIMNREQIGMRLREARETAGLSRDAVVAHPDIPVSRTTLQQWETGATEASLETIGKLAALYGASPQFLVFGEESVGSTIQQNMIQAQPSNEDEYVYIPAYDIEASAGHGSCIGEGEESNKHLAFRQKWVNGRGLNAKDLVGLFTKGDSMEPTIADGGAIIIDKSRNQIIDSRVYVISINGDLFVKRVQRLPNGLKLISDNKFYEPLTLSNEDLNASNIKICGQVIHASYDLPD